jgi:hypothetical protein
MLVKSEAHEPSPHVRKIAHTFRLLGWIDFSTQLGLAFVACSALLFAYSGFNSAAGTGIGIGMFWALCGLLVLSPTIVFAFRYTRIAKGLLREPDAHLHPKKADTVLLLRLGTIIGLVGMLLVLIGAGTSVGVLVAKTVSQPPGMAITDPNKLVRALDVYVVLANLALMAAHFVGTVTSLWLLERIHSASPRHPSPRPS